MATNKEIKKKASEEWKHAFPQLSFYAQNKLYETVGPIIIGIELIKSPFTDAYSPYFVIYPLWKEDIKSSLNYPILLKAFKNKKGFQYDIPYEKHSVFFDDARESVKKQSPLLFERNISLKKITDVLDEYSKTPPLSAASNSYLQALLQEAKLKIALSISSKEAEKILEQTNKKSWDVQHFTACGVDVNEWLQGLKKAISNRDEFLSQIEANKQDKKIMQLKSSEIIE